MSQSIHSVSGQTVPAAATDRSVYATILGRLGRWLIAAVDTIAVWAERHRERRALEAMPDYMLRDIGVSRADAVNEAEKPFWK